MPYLYTNPSRKFLANIKTINNISGRKIIAFSPHSDDLSIGAGGFLAELASKNTIIPVLGYTGWRGVEDKIPKTQSIKIREKEMQNEAAVLGINQPVFLRLLTYEKENIASQTKDVEKIKVLIKKEKPEIVFLPNRLDLHPRHRLLASLILTALKELKRKTKLFFYEIPWSVFSGKEFNFIVPLSRQNARKKISAIKAHRSQLKRTDFVRLSKALLALRAGMVPEQKVGGYGSSLNLGAWVEVYKFSVFP